MNKALSEECSFKLLAEALKDKYSVVKVLGTGAVGSVYLVQNLHLNRTEALKVCADTKENEVFLKEEAKILKSLNHPMLPVVYDLIRKDGIICIAMEFVGGMTLELYLQTFGPVGEEVAITWAIALTDVLGYMHRQKPALIYRDLKPANIMVQPDGTIRLIDLGAVYVPAYGCGEEGMLMGTPEYSAPEQWQEKSACKESDIYALGMVLHEMLSGLHPVSACQKRRPVREYNRSISRRLEQIISICTETKTEKRFHSMEQLRTELQGCKQKQKHQERWMRFKRGIGRLLIGLALLRTTIPFLWGVKIKEFPFPYMKMPIILFGVAWGYRVLIVRTKNSKRMVKSEKSIFLTEKKFPGLYVGVLLLMLLCNKEYVRKGMLQKPAFWTEEQVLEVSAAEEQEEIWVDMRDEQGRKCLLKEDMAFCLRERMWFEVTKESLPKGISSIRLVVVGADDAVYESRVFLVENN